jgi:predicted metal-dependent HD superfamily phosphohydrolase
MNLKDRWYQTLKLTIDHVPAIFTAECWAQIERRYSERHRRYHTLAHLEACFKLYDEIKWGGHRDPAIEFALWFHDIVYEPQQINNEAQSALLFTRVVATTLRDVDDIIASALRMIVISDHKTPPSTDAEKLFCDIDLSILGEAEPIFDIYEEDIRREYDFVPDDIYKLARGRIMEGFLERAKAGKLFHTPAIKEKYHHQSIANLKRSIRKLD